MTTKPFKAREAKYGKFAYSSAFAFSVPTGNLLTQMAPDSTMCASIDGGESWKARWQPTDVRIEYVSVVKEGGALYKVPSLISTWRPWKHINLQVETTLVALEWFPGWHVRVHSIQLNNPTEILPWVKDLQLVDGGFAITSHTSVGTFLSQENYQEATGNCIVQEDMHALVLSDDGTSGVSDLFVRDDGVAKEGGANRGSIVRSEALVLRADPNTNLMSQRTFIPAVKHSVSLDHGLQQRPGKMISLDLASGVFAISQAARLGSNLVKMLWEDRPLIEIDETESPRFRIVSR